MSNKRTKSNKKKSHNNRIKGLKKWNKVVKMVGELLKTLPSIDFSFANVFNIPEEVLTSIDWYDLDKAVEKLPIPIYFKVRGSEFGQLPITTTGSQELVMRIDYNQRRKFVSSFIYPVLKNLPLSKITNSKVKSLVQSNISNLQGNTMDSSNTDWMGELMPFFKSTTDKIRETIEDGGGSQFFWEGVIQKFEGRNGKKNEDYYVDFILFQEDVPLEPVGEIIPFPSDEVGKPKIKVDYSKEKKKSKEISKMLGVKPTKDLKKIEKTTRKDFEGVESQKIELAVLRNEEIDRITNLYKIKAISKKQLQLLLNEIYKKYGKGGIA